MLYGYAGKLLFVDLTRGVIKEENLAEKMCRNFIGGYGLGIRILYEMMEPKVDPLGPDSILGFVTGVLTATSVPGSGRYMVIAKSPLTGTWGEANSGGYFGPELKTAGYDAVFFSGISSEPVYLLIKDGKVELKYAGKIWGKDTYETDDILHQEIGDQSVKIACIGPSGESRSLLAGIVNEKGRIAARGGLGAVMGSKRLKAMAVKGGIQKISIADPEKLKEARLQVLANLKSSDFAKGLTELGTGAGIAHLVSIGDSPIKNWRLSGIDAMPTVTKLSSANMEKYKKESYGCHSCPVRCGAIIEQKEGPFAIPDEMHRPEYESLAALGNLLMNDNLESIIKANDTCNRYGIDTISTGGTIAFAMECYERGLITRIETGGMELTWGNPEAIVELTEKIGRREGFGAVLADGTDKAAERIGKGSEQYAVSIRGKPLPFHDPRMSPSGGTAFIADANPSHHTKRQVIVQMENGVRINPNPVFQMPKLKMFGDYDQKGHMYAVGFKYHQLLDAAGYCSLYTTGTIPPPLAEMIASVTGWDFDWTEGLKAGHRILTLRQAFNAREGITPDQITLPKRMLDEPLTGGPCANKKIDFESLRKGYFAVLGWDIKTGKPDHKVLDELGLADLVKD